MNYCSLLDSYGRKKNSIICLGLDPIIERIPISEKNPGKKITIFFETILNEIIKTNIYPSAVKPNYAFYSQYGIDGIQSLFDVISMFKKEGIPVILDSKRGDIGATSSAYAKETFEFLNADAVTLAPYMGFDTINPFTSNYPDKGFYVLCRTSNTSARDFQDLEIDKTPLYMKVAEKICLWSNNDIGAVVGATYPSELESIQNLCKEKKKNIPFLIPGIGTQGGDLSAVINILLKNENIYIHRINSSSGILYAHEKKPNTPYFQTAVSEIKLLNDDINKIIGM